MNLPPKSRANLYKLLINENYTLNKQVAEITDMNQMLQRNAQLMDRFVMSIYDFSSNIPSSATCINISSFDFLFFS